MEQNSINDSIRIIWNGISYDVFQKNEIPLLMSSPAYIPTQEIDENLRSPDWVKVRDTAVKKQPYCSICESKKELQVHHIKPFHIFPELELVETNLIVLCRRDHFIFGHLTDWKSYNINIIKDAKIWHKKLGDKPFKHSSPAKALLNPQKF